MKDFSEYKNVWVFAEQRQGKLMNVALELIGEGYKLSREISKDTKLCAVLAGHDVDHLVEELYAYGADCVYAVSYTHIKREKVFQTIYVGWSGNRRTEYIYFVLQPESCQRIASVHRIPCV